MIDRLLCGQWTAQEFEGAFPFYYYEHVPVEVMRSPAASLYSAVVEKLEFTTANPTTAEREEEWIDYADFVNWLRSEYQRIGTVG